jgi:TPR repeat protein
MERSLKKLKSIPLLELALKARRDKKYEAYIFILKEGLKNNDEECIYLLAQWYDYKGRYEKAVKLFKKNNNHFKSMAKFAGYTSVGLECEKDIKKANEIRLCILNSSGNYFAKGLCFLYESGCFHNQKKAFENFLKAAEEGDSEGQNYLSTLFDTENNKVEGFKWNLKSAEQGNLEAIDKMPMRYYEGMGIKKDFEKALYWDAITLRSHDYSHYLYHELNIPDRKLKGCDVDSLINLHLARCYLHGEKVNERSLYLSWYFYKKTKEVEAIVELRKLKNSVFKEFANNFKVILTLLCISKISSKYLNIPKDIFVLLAKCVFDDLKKK